MIYTMLHFRNVRPDILGWRMGRPLLWLLVSEGGATTSTTTAIDFQISFAPASIALRALLEARPPPPLVLPRRYVVIRVVFVIDAPPQRRLLRRGSLAVKTASMPSQAIGWLWCVKWARERGSHWRRRCWRKEGNHEVTRRKMSGSACMWGPPTGSHWQRRCWRKEGKHEETRRKVRGKACRLGPPTPPGEHVETITQ